MTTEVDTLAAADRMAVSYPDPTASVNLLPPEIVADRAVRGVKRRVSMVLVVVVLAIVAADVWFRLDDSRASTALQGEQATVIELQAAQAKFVALPMIAAQQAAISRTLTVLMTNDTLWNTDLAALRTSGVGAIRFTAVDASVKDVGPAAAVGTDASIGSLDRSGAEQVGVLTVTGRAPDHAAVAAWVATLPEVDGFLVPYILGSRVVSDNGGEVEFIVEITLGSVLRSLRYAEPTPGTIDAGGG